MSLLEVDGLSVTFGTTRVVNDVDLRVQKQQIVGLIGPNGAGKTTTIDALTGFVPSRGRITFKGEDISRLRAHTRARRGMTRTWQSLELFDDLSVRSNLEVASARLNTRALLDSLIAPMRGRNRPEVDATLERLGLAHLGDSLPSALSHGQRKLVGVARAMAASPELLLLDEPAAGLDEEETAELATAMRRMQGEGATIFIIDHDMGLVLGVCDYVYVLDFGLVIASGTPAEIRQNERVIEAYLGTSAAETVEADLAAVPAEPAEAADRPVLEPASAGGSKL